MATKPYARISSGGVVRVEVFMEYDDTDWRTTNSDGEPDDYRVIRWFGTNHGPSPFTVELKLSNGKRWKTATVAAGETFSVDAGGQVRYESDVPEWRYS